MPSDYKTARVIADQFAVLAEPTRLRIAELLTEKEMSVTEIAGALGITMVNASHHLTTMRAAKLLESARRGRFVFYSLSPAVYHHGAFAFGHFRVSIGATRAAAR